MGGRERERRVVVGDKTEKVVVGILIVGYDYIPHIHEGKGILSHERVREGKPLRTMIPYTIHVASGPGAQQAVLTGGQRGAFFGTNGGGGRVHSLCQRLLTTHHASHAQIASRTAPHTHNASHVQQCMMRLECM
jgi:hypothetical protein